MPQQRITPPHIDTLLPHQVFVFGSNESGRHGKGAAKTARIWFGAVNGNPEGLQGNSYALPTVNKGITKALPLSTIARYVDRFVECAKANPHLEFLVTEVGCGLAGRIVEDIAPLFKQASAQPNIFLPARFWAVLEKDLNNA